MGFMEWVLPKENQFFEMLSAQSENCLQAARELDGFVREYSSATAAKRETSVRSISARENKGDDITHAIIEKLNSSFITPIDKEDLYQMACLLDDIIDIINAAAVHMVLFNVKKTDKCMVALSGVIVQIVGEVDICVTGLRNLKNMKTQHIRIHSLENKGDDIYHEGLAALFRKSRDPIDIMKRREIYGLLESVIDKCESVENVMENILVKHA